MQGRSWNAAPDSTALSQKDRSTYQGMGWEGGVWGRQVGVGSMSNCHCHWLCLDTKSLCSLILTAQLFSLVPKLNPCTQLKFLEFKPSGVYMAYCDLNKDMPSAPSFCLPMWEWKTQQTLVTDENSCPDIGEVLDEPQFCSCGLSALPTVASSVPWKLFLSAILYLNTSSGHSESVPP